MTSEISFSLNTVILNPDTIDSSLALAKSLPLLAAVVRPILAQSCLVSYFPCSQFKLDLNIQWQSPQNHPPDSMQSLNPAERE